MSKIYFAEWRPMMESTNPESSIFIQYDPNDFPGKAEGASWPSHILVPDPSGVMSILYQDSKVEFVKKLSGCKKKYLTLKPTPVERTPAEHAELIKSLREVDWLSAGAADRNRGSIGSLQISPIKDLIAVSKLLEIPTGRSLHLEKGELVDAIIEALKEEQRVKRQQEAEEEANKKKQLEQAARAEAQRSLGEEIYAAAYEGDLKSLKRLLGRVQKEKKSLAARREVQRWANSDGMTPLYVAVEEGHAECVNALLESHYSANQARNDGLSPLWVAIQNNQVDLVQALLNANAKPDQAVQGTQPLYVACENGYLEVARLLLEAGASPTHRTQGGKNKGWDPMMVALNNKHTEVVSLLKAYQKKEEAGPSAASEASSSGSEKEAVAVLPVEKKEEKRASSYKPALGAIQEDDDWGEEGEEEDEEEEDGAGSEEMWRKQELINEALEQLESGTTTDDVHKALIQVKMASIHGRYEEQLAAGRERLRKLKRAKLSPLYEFADFMPSDFEPWAKGSFTSHTILVVDCSGSMRKADVATDAEAGAPPISRAAAIRHVLQQTFLRTQIKDGAVTSERVSLIQIKPEVAVPFALLPLDDKLSERIHTALDEPAGHGPYVPALKKLVELATMCQKHMTDHAKTNVLFMSDGRPSDQVDERMLPKLISAELVALHKVCPRLESFQLLGFGDADEDTLKYMKEAVPDNLATYTLSSGRDGITSLEQSVSTFASSVGVSRISSVAAFDGKHRQLRRINQSLKERMQMYEECDIYLPPKELGAINVDELQPVPGLHDIEISSLMLGHGGERNAYLMRFLRDNKFTSADEEWVVKESRHERSEEAEQEFHTKALVTQKAAAELAKCFNEEALALGLEGLPKVSYMTCCFLMTSQMKLRDGEKRDAKEPESRNLFAERKIEGTFRKWNTNFGACIETIAAPEQEREDRGGAASSSSAGKTSKLSSDLIPQAFSHFTIEFSQRPKSGFFGPSGKRGSVLVCDLQGCYDKKLNTFLLSDPAIHSDLGQECLFGPTDRGKSGIDKFLESHKCNEVCRMLKLPTNKMFKCENVVQRDQSSVNTSLVSIVETKHLRHRENLRTIEKIENQTTKKHGVAIREPSGNIMHQLGDHKFVTDKSRRIGVTAMRRGQEDPSEMPPLPPVPHGEPHLRDGQQQHTGAAEEGTSRRSAR